MIASRISGIAFAAAVLALSAAVTHAAGRGGDDLLIGGATTFDLPEPPPSAMTAPGQGPNAGDQHIDLYKNIWLNQGELPSAAPGTFRGLRSPRPTPSAQGLKAR